uniref:Uncharacterized protein n=2 Tax=Thermococcus sp. CIR10 TaxID=1197731 RepID=L0BAR1_9EURY|nr:hypothetical protein c10-8 [Thermococcus sp. CIR10]
MSSRFYPKARIEIPNQKPYTLEQFLQLFFGEHPANIKVKMAKALMEEVRSRMPRGWNSEGWIQFILKVMAEEYEGAQYLLDYYDTIRWTKKKSEIPKLLEAKCFELGLTEEGERKAKGREVALFTIYKGAYSVVVRTLRNAKILKKVDGHYILSDEFEKILEGIAEFYRYWRKEKID